MILDAEIVKQMLSGKRSMVRVPVRAGEKVCTYRPGKAYVVKVSQKAPASLHITITDVRQELHDDALVWVLRFQKGDHTDTPRLLAARSGGPGGDYTTVPARAMRAEGEAVSPELLSRYAVDGRERHASTFQEASYRALAAISVAQEYAVDPRVRKRLRAAANQIRAVENEAKPAA